MTEENLKSNYKQHSCNLSLLKDRNREFCNEIRKVSRNQVLSRKRFPKKEDDPHQGELLDFNIEKVKEVTKLIKRPSSNTQSQLHYLRLAFSYSQDFVDAFLDIDNSVYTLVGYLTGNDSTLQLEASWCITNMSANDHKKMLFVVKSTAPYLITYLESGSELLINQSAWALGNMAADDAECRLLLKEQGVIKPLIDLVKKKNYSGALQASLFALCNMARSPELVIPELFDSAIPNTLIEILNNLTTDLNIIGELAWLLSYMTMDENHCLVFVEKGILPCLVHWLCKVRPHQQEYLFAVTPLLRDLGNIIGIKSISNLNSIFTLENGSLLETLNNFLFSNKRHLIKECLWVLANIFACNFDLKNYIESVKLLIPNISRHLLSAYEIKKEAAICMCNIISYDKEVGALAATKETIQHFIDFLTVPSNELKFIALHFFELLIKQGGEGEKLFSALDGPSYLEGLECSESDKVRNKAIFLLETFYENENEDPSLDHV
ncbi:importin subunit alpha-6 [Hydra vulgaris]|uniref:importin subunit alpha-6 n=1 Tax=Hydra vulgaris TaxID=6087 RepID=UPI001F5F9568|nr:importin subunit alpha-6-like [Hydra vulgaris]